MAGAGTHLGLGPVARITTDCGQCYRGGIYARFLRPLAVHYFVSPDTFRLLGVRLVTGRLLDAGDTRTAAPVAVVSQSLANGWFENGAALGRGIQLGDDRNRWYTVVGVVSDFTGAGFGAGQLPAEQAWVGVLQAPPVTGEVLVPPGGVKPTGAALGAGEPMPDRLEREAAPGAWFGRWLGVEALLLLGLAILGLAAFARLWVLSLRPTLGLRRAAGARRGQVIGFVMRQAVLVGVGGVLVGAWFGPAVWLALPDLLPGLPAWDPAVMLMAATLLVTIMALGALAPAVRAAREAPAALVAGAEEA
ncbi:MAG: ABC transporter permease [Gemmatimonadetes bacterium]|nr:ABC transporter permease [Gemmatimonadota bacterium]